MDMGFSPGETGIRGSAGLEVENVVNAAGGTTTAADVHRKASNCLDPRMDKGFFSGFVFVDLQI